MSAAGRSRRLPPACVPLPALPTARYFLCCRRPPAHVARGQAAPAPPSNGRYRPPGPCRPLTRRGRPSPAQTKRSPARPIPEGKGDRPRSGSLKFPTPGHALRPGPARPSPAAHPLAHGGGRLRAGQAAGSEERGSAAPRVPAGGRCGTIAAPRPPLAFLLLPPRLLAFASPPSAPARIAPVSRRSRPQLREPPASRRIKNPRHTAPPRPGPPHRPSEAAGRRGGDGAGAERGGEGGRERCSTGAARPRVHLGAHLGCPSRASPRWGEAGRGAGAPSATEKAPPARPEARPPEGATRGRPAAAMPGRAAPGAGHRAPPTVPL